MYIEKELWNELKECINNLYWDEDRMSSDGLYFLNKLEKCSREIDKTSSNKIYVVTNNAIVDDQIDYQIKGIATTKEESEKLFKEAIKDAKCDADFDNLNAINVNDDTHSDYEQEWLYDETDTSFELYLNGEYNSNNFSIQIKEFDVNQFKDCLKLLDKNAEDELEL